MSYRKIVEFFRSGNISAAKTALVEALKNNALTTVEKVNILRTKSEALLESYVAAMKHRRPRQWELMEIVHSGNIKVIESIEIDKFPVPVQKEMLKLNNVEIFRHQFERHPNCKFCNKVDIFIIRSQDKQFAQAYVAINWLEKDAEEEVLASNDMELIQAYFGKYNGMWRTSECI